MNFFSWIIRQFKPKPSLRKSPAEWRALPIRKRKRKTGIKLGMNAHMSVTEVAKELLRREATITHKTLDWDSLHSTEKIRYRNLARTMMELATDVEEIREE